MPQYLLVIWSNISKLRISSSLFVSSHATIKTIHPWIFCLNATIVILSLYLLAIWSYLWKLYMNFFFFHLCPLASNDQNKTHDKNYVCLAEVFSLFYKNPSVGINSKLFSKPYFLIICLKLFFQTWFCLFGLYRSVFASSDKFFMWNLCHQIVFHDSNSVLKKTDLSQWICLWSSSKFLQGSCSPPTNHNWNQVGRTTCHFPGLWPTTRRAANQMHNSSTFCIPPQSLTQFYFFKSHFKRQNIRNMLVMFICPIFTRKKTCFVVDVFNHDIP